MSLDWSKIEKTWHDFSSNHNMTLQDIDQHLLTTKRQIYYTIEKFNNCEIHYRYVFFKLDPIDAGNDFRIIIPVETDKKVKICQPFILSRLISKKKIKIKPVDEILIIDKIEKLIIDVFKNFPDLAINIGFSPIPSMSADRYDKVLEIQTRKLPTDINGLKKLRELIIVLNDYLTDKELIKANKHNNASA